MPWFITLQNLKNSLLYKIFDHKTLCGLTAKTLYGQMS